MVVFVMRVDLGEHLVPPSSFELGADVVRLHSTDVADEGFGRSHVGVGLEGTHDTPESKVLPFVDAPGTEASIVQEPVLRTLLLSLYACSA